MTPKRRVQQRWSVDRVETVPMSEAQYAVAVDALAALICSWSLSQSAGQPADGDGPPAPPSPRRPTD